MNQPSVDILKYSTPVVEEANPVNLNACPSLDQ